MSGFTAQVDDLVGKVLAEESILTKARRGPDKCDSRVSYAIGPAVGLHQTVFRFKVVVTVLEIVLLQGPGKDRQHNQGKSQPDRKGRQAEVPGKPFPAKPEGRRHRHQKQGESEAENPSGSGEDRIAGTGSNEETQEQHTEQHPGPAPVESG